MKKILTILIMSLAFIMTSCGFNNFSNEEGSLSFEIPVDQLAGMAARDGAADELLTYDIVAQIKGSKGYYQKQVSTVVINAVELAKANETNPDKDNVGTYFTNEVFSFDSLPMKQTYSISIDILVKSPEKKKNSSDPDVWIPQYFSDKSSISLKKNQATSVVMQIDSYNVRDSALYNYQVTYKLPNGTEKTVELAIDDFAKEDTYSLLRRNGQLLYQDGSNLCPVTSVKVGFKKDNHLYAEGEISIYSTDIYYEEKNLIGKFTDGNFDLTSYLKKNIEIFTSYAQISWNGYLLRRDNLGVIVIDNAGISTKINLNTVRDPNVTDKQRYRIAIPLSSINGGETVVEGKTMVFVLSQLRLKEEIIQDSYINELHYRFDSVPYSELDPTELDNKVTVIKMKSTGHMEYDDPIIITANLMKGNEAYLNLYLDHENYIEDTMPYSVDIDYYSFAPEEKVFVFNSNFELKDNEHIYRNEFIYSINDLLQSMPEENDTITVTISGTLTSDANPYAIYLKTEFFDNAYYEGSYYHPLSQDKISDGHGGEVDNEDNIKQGYFYSGDPLRFVFAHIRAPSIQIAEDEHDFRFQCYNQLSAGEVIENFLYIRGFEISVQISQ